MSSIKTRSSLRQRRSGEQREKTKFLHAKHILIYSIYTVKGIVEVFLKWGCMCVSSVLPTVDDGPV